MINRDMKPVQVITWVSTLDEYGQSRNSGHSSRTTDMVSKLYSQNNTNDIRYVDVEMIGITKDKLIDDSNSIVIDGVLYNILYVIPSGKYNQILMKKSYENWNS